ncbi:hypothetical protein J7E62_05455 [Variovorax paradoxus]|nr:hypothetical protein [Variovorax paradoxus]
MKQSWLAAAGLAALMLCMTGCKGSGVSAALSRDGNASASPPSPPSAAPATAAWRPNDRTSEFLSAWRAKE